MLMSEKDASTSWNPKLYLPAQIMNNRHGEGATWGRKPAYIEIPKSRQPLLQPKHNKSEYCLCTLYDLVHEPRCNI
jgi:hypothetical protein